MAPGKNLQILDALSLFSLKVGPNIFDISSSMHHVSIRDQIVRGQLLIRDLTQANENIKSILIVGCGAAGASAALAASAKGIKHVVVVDAQAQPFSLLRNVTARYVGPFMYEWPGSMYKDQSYPGALAARTASAHPELSWSSATPCPANELAKRLEYSFDTGIKQLKNNLTVALGVDAVEIKKFVHDFRHRHRCGVPRQSIPVPSETQSTTNPTISASTKHIHIQPDYIVLAGGMGRENCWLRGKPDLDHDFKGTAFWENDNLLAASTANLQVGIFGGGDGALQDVLRALTGLNHPLDLIGRLERDPGTRAAIAQINPELLSLERQSRKLSTWTANDNVFLAIDSKCEELAKHLAKRARVRKSVLKNLRRGTGGVSLFVRETHFTKTYLLNRFLVHPIDCCEKHPDFRSGVQRMRLKVYFNASAVKYSPPTNGCKQGPKVVDLKIGVEPSTRILTTTLDEIVVRYGLHRWSVPGAQMVQLSPKRSSHRTRMSRIELPFVME